MKFIWFGIVLLFVVIIQTGNCSDDSSTNSTTAKKQEFDEIINLYRGAFEKYDVQLQHLQKLTIELLKILQKRISTASDHKCPFPHEHKVPKLDKEDDPETTSIPDSTDYSEPPTECSEYDETDTTTEYNEEDCDSSPPPDDYTEEPPQCSLETECNCTECCNDDSSLIRTMTNKLNLVGVYLMELGRYLINSESKPSLPIEPDGSAMSSQNH